MANTMQFDLVSPERRLASLEVSAVQIPGADGDLTAMPGHAPVITNLRPGILKVEAPSGNTDYVVTGGFAEIGEGLSVLAERALPLDEYLRMLLMKSLKRPSPCTSELKRSSKINPVL